MSNDFYVYILRCANGAYYVGHTDDIEKRMAEHGDGKFGGYTSRHKPIELVFLQSFQTREDAFRAEHKIKNWSRKKKEALIKNDWDSLKLHAKKIFNLNHPSIHPT